MTRTELVRRRRQMHRRIRQVVAERRLAKAPAPRPAADAGSARPVPERADCG